jgi:hypothetical protein
MLALARAGSGTGRKTSVATKRKSVAGLPLALGSSTRRQSNVSPSRRQSTVTPGSRRQSNATGRRKSVAAQQTGRRKSIANLPSGRRASSASGASGLTVLAGAGVPESKWQKAQKLTLANVFFPPVHGGMLCLVYVAITALALQHHAATVCLLQLCSKAAAGWPRWFSAFMAHLLH